MDCIAIDQRASVGSSFNLILGHIGERYARDLLVPLRQDVLISLYEKMEGLDKRIGLACARTCFNKKAVITLQAGIDLVEGLVASLLGRIEVFSSLNHC